MYNPVYDEDLLQEWGDEDFDLLVSWTEEIERSLGSLRYGTRTKASVAAEAIFGSKVGSRSMPVVTAAAAPSVVVPSKPWSM